MLTRKDRSMVGSTYNFFIEQDDGTCLAYNARTSAMVMLDRINWREFKDFLNGSLKYNDLSKLDDWIRGGFIIDSLEMEKNIIRFGLNRSRFSTQNLSITVAPTLGCNFNCQYCYEKNAEVSKAMPHAVQDAVIQLLESNIPTISSFDITWYGGEPMLEQDIIKSLSERIIKICEEKSVDYSAFIVTNGYLLDKRAAESLKNLKVRGAQVTIDGTRDVHDARRPLVGGGPTFDRIMHNLIECSDILDMVLRINIDRLNVSKNNELLDQLDRAGLKEKVAVYLGWVEPSNGCCDQANCLTLTDFSTEKLRFAKNLLERGFKYDAMSDYPQRRHNLCGADSFNSQVIAPNGDTYRCWSDIGIERFKTGSIVDSNIQGNHERFYQYMLYDPTYDPECVSCKFLPVCMGGCPKRRIDKNVERCTHVKSHLNQYLENSAKIIAEQRSKDASSNSNENIGAAPA